ncbi:MAG: cell division protein SepF [Promethearchaeota archaeon]|nr:MAG: cell division protein SepF [Candidatus Lokiarchaeota archaeon]
MKLFKKNQDENLLSSPKETLGFKKMDDSLQQFLIKKYKFSSLNQMDDIKKQLMGRKILIINAKEILDSGKIQILELKKIIDELKSFVRELGGSIARLGDQYLILTPNSYVKISN